MSDPLPPKKRPPEWSEAELIALGLPPELLDRVERAREEFLASGLTREEFSQRAMEKLEHLRELQEKAEEKLHQQRTGWTGPILAGFVGTALIEVLWSTARGHGSMKALASLVVTALTVAFTFDYDDLPPRKRLILGALIGGLIAILLSLGAQLS